MMLIYNNLLQSNSRKFLVTLILGLDDLLHFSDDVTKPTKQHGLIISSFGTTWWTCLNECIGTTVPLLYSLQQFYSIYWGGVIGTERQILHLSVSCNNRCRPSGILASLFRVNISLIAFLSSPTSSMSTFSFSSLERSILTLLPLACRSQHRHLSQWWNGVTSEVATGLLSSISFLETAYVFQHGHLQNVIPTNTQK